MLSSALLSYKSAEVLIIVHKLKIANSFKVPIVIKK